VNKQGTVDFWEEHACQESLKSNCYCFAVNRYIGSYCSPGESGDNNDDDNDYGSCAWATRGIITDGGIQVDRDTVYSKQPKGHYIALAVWPGEDFHMWRLENNGSWANKPGAYMPRRTYGSSNAVIKDVEVKGVRGEYTDFCGYFEVFTATHKLKGTDYWSYGLPGRYESWSRIGLHIASTPMSSISKGWKLAYKEFWQVSGSNSGTTNSITAEAGRKLMQGTARHGLSRLPRAVTKP
jgi:hypothetical protein